MTFDVSDLSSNPYRGLASFTYETRAYYGGRDQQIAEAVRVLSAEGDEPALVFVTGASGSGKSSFVQAGVVPALEGQYGTRLRWAVARPGRHPMLAINRALEGLDQAHAASSPVDGAGVGGNAVGATDQKGAFGGQEAVRVLVLDQFEELFTQAAADERTSALGWLRELRAFKDSRLQVIATLRSDYLPAIFNEPALLDAFKRCGVELRAMTSAELATAIRTPLLEQARIDSATKAVQPALVERLVEDVGSDSTLLPLLQVTLTALWDEPPHTLTLERYRSLTDALEQQAERAYAYTSHGKPRTACERDQVLAIFLDLTEVSLDDDPQRDVRRTVARPELIGEHVERTTLIEELVAARLLATTLDPESDRELVDIIHETLLRNWARLREAIQSARERLQMGVRFRLALREWIEHAKSDDYLLEGVRLAEGRALAAQRDISVLAPDAVELLSRSGQKEQAERERELAQARALAEEQKARSSESARAAGRLRKWLIVTAVAAVLAIGAAGVAVTAFLQADRQARINSSRELAAVSQAQLGVDPELSILLAREGVADRGAATQQASEALRSALARSPSRLALRQAGAVIGTASLSPDGQHAVTGASDGSLRMWNAVTGAVEAELRSGGPAVSRVSFSPDGQRVVSAASDGSVVLWDGSGKQVAQLPSGMVSALAWSAGGQRLALAQAGGMVRVLDGRTGSLVREWSTQAQGQGRQQAAQAMGLRLAPALDLVDSGARGQVWAAPQGPGGLQSRQQGQDATRAPELSVASQAGEAQATSRGKAQQPTRALTNHSHQTTQAIWAWLASALGLSHGGACGQTGEVSHGPVDSQSQLQGQDATTATEMTAVSAAGEAHARSRGQAQQATYAQTNPSQQAMRAQANLDQEAVPGQTTHAQMGSSAEAGQPGDEQRAIAGLAQERAPTTFARARGVLDSEGVGLMQRTALGLAQGQVTIGALGLSPDGRRLVAAGFGASARVWDVDSGEQVSELRGHLAPIADARFSSDGARIVTASQDGSARVWDAATGTALQVLETGSGALRSALFTQDGSRVLTAGTDGVARVWDSATGRQLSILRGHTGPLSGATMSSDGQRVLTASFDHTAAVWDAASGDELLVLRGHLREVTSAQFSADGRHALTTSLDGAARIWQVTSGQDWLELAGHSGKVYTAAFSPDGHQIASGGRDNTVRLWTGSASAERPQASAVTSVAYSPDGQRLVVALQDGSARISSLGARVAPDVDFAGHSSAVYTAEFSPDGAHVVTASADGSARTWTAGNGQQELELRGHAGDVTSATYDRTGERIATSGSDGTVRIWDTRTGRADKVLQVAPGGLHRVTFSPDGKQVATAGEDGVVRVWDVDGGKETRALAGHTGAVYSVDFSADGKLLISGSADRSVLVWDTSTWQHFAELRGSTEEVSQALFSADGQEVVVASADGNVRVYGREMFAPLDEVLALVPSRITREPATLTEDERARFVH